MFKKISIIIMLCLISSLTFAQTAPKQVLSEKDINNFITNYKKIMDAFDILDDKYSHLFDSIDENSGFEGMIKMRSIKVPAEIQDIFRKNGLGDNGFEKVLIIIQGTMVVVMEDDIKSLSEKLEANKEWAETMAESIKQSREAVKTLKNSINNRDLALINSKKDKLIEILK